MPREFSRDLSKEIRRRVMQGLSMEGLEIEVPSPPSSPRHPGHPGRRGDWDRGGADLSVERMRVLEMLEQGKITAADAAELLRALGDEDERVERDEDSRGDRPRWFRVRVTDVTTGRQKANVSIPFGMVNFGLRFAPGNFRFKGRGMPRQVDDLLDALRSGRRGTLYDITDKNEGERIEIIVE